MIHLNILYHSNSHFLIFHQPSQPEDGIYDAKIKLSKQAITEIQSFLGDKDQLTPGALDQAISQILVDVRPHIEGARMWHLEDIFGLEFDTAKMVTPSI